MSLIVDILMILHITFAPSHQQLFIEFSIFAEFFFAFSVDSNLSMQAVNSWEDMAHFSLTVWLFILLATGHWYSSCSDCRHTITVS